MAQEDQAGTEPTSAQKFWRDVAVQSLAGIIVAVVVYVGALMFGYLNAPPVRDIAVFFLGLITPTCAVLLLMYRRASGKRTPWWVVALIWAVALAAWVWGLVTIGRDPSWIDEVPMFPNFQ
jgi:hypothetical protein